MPTKKNPAPAADVITPDETVIEKNTDVWEIEEFELNSFKGISKDHPVFFDFRNLKPKENITILTGDEGTGKTSTLEGLLYLCGSQFDFKNTNFINDKDGTISGKLSFKKNGRSYKVLASKTKFELFKKFRDADSPDSEPTWLPQESPKEMLKSLIGYVATSPMFLKEAKGEEQIKWLYGILNISPEVKAEEKKITDALTSATESRKEANRHFERIQAALSENQFYQNWEQSETFYKEEKTADSLRDKLNEADNKRQQYQKNEVLLTQLKKDSKDKSKRISELEIELNDLKKAANAVDKRIATGESYLQENKSVIADYDKINEEFQNVSSYVQNRASWIATIKQKQEMDQFSDMVVKLDAQKKELAQKKKDLVKKIMPDIPGFEAETEKGIDSKRDIGIYLNGKSPAKLSESELHTLQLLVLKKQGIGMVVVENLSSFGEEAINTLNVLSESGVKIFGSLAVPSQKNIAIVVKEKIKLETKLG